MGVISIKSLEVFAYHGVLDDEKQRGQRFLLSAELGTELWRAAESDELADTVNYAEVATELVSHFTQQKHNLIERCADSAARFVLQRFPRINSVRLTVDKPDAPIDCTFSSVSVTVERTRRTAYIGLGSNMGDKRASLDRAIELIGQRAAVVAVSNFIKTAPVGVSGQDDYLNAAVALKTDMHPHELLQFLLSIESDMGRVRLKKWDSRPIDLDILLIDDLVITSDALVVPHPLMHRRRFVLEPLNQIAPHALHPLLNRRVCDLVDDAQ